METWKHEENWETSKNVKDIERSFVSEPLEAVSKWDVINIC
jgi:hypothetical protein